MRTIHITKEKIRSLFRHVLFRVILVSLITMLAVICIVALVVFHYRASIYKILAREYQQYVAEQQSLVPAVASPIVEKEIITEIPVAQDTVVDAVKKGKPAVVSIVISKDVLTYDISYQNSEIFPGIFGQIETPTQNGTERKQIGSGSGFLISSDGLIVTNRHVVSDTAAYYDVLLNNGKKYFAKVLARDSVYDVALVKIEAKDLPYVELGNSDSLDVGQSVIAIGNALGQFKNSVSVGVVSGLSRSVTAGDSTGQSEHLDKVIQTDAAINPGNSGGPLLNLHGEVVGINVAVVEGSSNVGFALPINTVKSAIASVRKTGTITRPYIGIRYIPINAAVQKQKSLSVDYGILIGKGVKASDLAVIAGSPADRAGIVEGDIILAVDGIKIDQEKDFASLIRGKTIGSTVKLHILSKGLEKDISLKLEKAPDNL